MYGLYVWVRMAGSGQTAGEWICADVGVRQRRSHEATQSACVRGSALGQTAAYHCSHLVFFYILELSMRYATMSIIKFISDD